jgi:hypothetical protein
VHTKLSDRQMNGWLYEWTHGQIGQKQNVSPRSIDFNLYNFWWWFKLKIAKNCLHNTNGNDETIYFELTFKSHCMHYKIVIQH